MRVNRILLHNLNNNLGKHIIILIISVITIVTAIVSLSFEGITLDIRTRQLEDMTLNEEIIVTPGEADDAEAISAMIGSIDNIKLTVPKTVTEVHTDISNDSFTLYGVNYGVQNSLSEIPILEGEASSAENGGIMISSELSDEYGLSVGDEVMLFIGGSQKAVKISAVCSKTCGLFDNYSTCLLADRSFAEQIIGIKVNRIDVSLENLRLIDETADSITAALKETGAEVSQKYDSSFYNSFVFTVVLALRIFVVFALIMAVYLIFTLYRTLIMEQASEMATLRTLGMTLDGYVSFVLKQTIVIYAVSAVSGFFLSKLLIRIMLGFFVGYKGDVSISFSPVVLIIVYAVFLAICVASVIAAIHTQVSMPVIEVLRSCVCLEKKNRCKLPTGIVCLAVSLILYYFIGNSVAFLIVSLLLVLTSMIMLSETAVSILTFITRRLGMNRYNIGLKQLGSLKSNYTIIFDLASFVIVLFITINAISGDLTSSISKIYGDESIYSEVYSDISDDELESIACEISADDYIRLRKATVAAEGEKYTMEAVPVENYSVRDYESVYGENVSHRELFERLNEESSVIISSTIAKNHGLEKGGTIDISGKKLKIAGIAATYENMGKMLYCSPETLENVGYEQSFDIIMFCCANADNAVEKIRERYDGLSSSYSVQTVEELFRANNERNQTIMKIVSVLSYFMGIVAFICLYNTIKICLQRKISNYVILRTVGADRTMLTVTEIIESAVNSAVNLLYALPFGYLVIRIVKSVVSFYYGEGGSGFCNIWYLVAIMLIIEAAYILCKIILLKKYLFKVDIVESIKKKAV